MSGSFIQFLDLEIIKERFPIVEDSIKKLENIQNHSYKKKHIAAVSLLHKSTKPMFEEEKLLLKVSSNESLEFLGDTLLNSFVTRKLFELYPYEKEGTLSKMRAFLVGTPFLAKLSVELGLPKLLCAAPTAHQAISSRTGEHKIEADLVEAVVGALFLDAGDQKLEKWLESLFLAEMKTMSNKQHESFDYKSFVQEWVQACLPLQPVYKEVDGDSQNGFTMSLTLNQVEFGRASAANKKEAAKLAAKAFYDEIAQRRITYDELKKRLGYQ